MATVESIMRLVLKTSDGCWLFAGPRDRNGYGLVYDAGTRTAHRAMYLHAVGPMPDGMVLDHLCRVRWCVNPDHLEVVTQAVNVRRARNFASENAAKTHCPSGHPLSGENLYPCKERKRICKICSKERSRKFKVKQRLAEKQGLQGAILKLAEEDR